MVGSNINWQATKNYFYFFAVRAFGKTDALAATFIICWMNYNMTMSRPFDRVEETRTVGFYWRFAPKLMGVSTIGTFSTLILVVFHLRSWSNPPDLATTFQFRSNKWFTVSFDCLLLQNGFPPNKPASAPAMPP
jgi:hypothetical protein